MSEDTLRWTVGSASITSIVESQTDGTPCEFFFPDGTADMVARHAWLRPHFADEHGHVHLRVQAFVIETWRPHGRGRPVHRKRS